MMGAEEPKELPDVYPEHVKEDLEAPKSFKLVMPVEALFECLPWQARDLQRQNTLGVRCVTHHSYVTWALKLHWPP